MMFSFMKRILIFIYLLIFNFVFCQKDVKIAFLADVHFQDLYGSFSDNNYRGAFNPTTGKPTLLRTMDAQLHSTRIFNENYFALLAALEEIGKSGIKIVALPGDFTDDGQGYNLHGLKSVLENYQKKYGLRFFITTGNHDPVRPFSRTAGKYDFLGENGQAISILSDSSLIKSKNVQNVITKDIAETGYLEVLEVMKPFGFAPDVEDLYWATPFSDYSCENYSFKKANNASELQSRQYLIKNGVKIPDLSYVVEPVKGIWLVAVDGNVYVPQDEDGKNLSGADVGYNDIIIYKNHLISWLKKLSADAKANGKTMVVFTHYPAVDFNDGASVEIEKLLGKGKWQMKNAARKGVRGTV